MEQTDMQRLMDAALMALGWMRAKERGADPVINGLAKTLKAVGSDCTYLDEIIAGSEVSQ